MTSSWTPHSIQACGNAVCIGSINSLSVSIWSSDSEWTIEFEFEFEFESWLISYWDPNDRYCFLTPKIHFQTTSYSYFSGLGLADIFQIFVPPTMEQIIHHSDGIGHLRYDLTFITMLDGDVSMKLYITKFHINYVNDGIANISGSISGILKMLSDRNSII